MCSLSQITYSNFWSSVQCWRPSARALAPSSPMLLQSRLHVNKCTKNTVKSSDSVMYVLAWFVSLLSAWPRIEKESLYSTPLTQFHPNGSVLASKEKLYHSVVWHFLQHSIDIAQAQCVPVLSPLHIGEGYLEIIEQWVSGTVSDHH